MVNQSLKEAWRYPAEELERIFDIQGISSKYRLPTDVVDSQLGSTLKTLSNKGKIGSLSTQKKNEFALILKTIISLNPSLKKITYDKDNIFSTIIFLLGVTSRLNPDDIAYYLSRPKATNPKKLIKADKHRISKLESDIARQNNCSKPNRLGWVPSAHTEKIIRLSL